MDAWFYELVRETFAMLLRNNKTANTGLRKLLGHS